MPDASRTAVSSSPAATAATAAARTSPRVRSRRIALDWASGAGVVLASLVLGIGAWELVILAFHVRPYTLPSPKSVAVQLGDSLGYLRPALTVTLGETLLGMGIATAAGVLLAIGIAASKFIERLAYPLLVVSNAVPKIALAPVFLAWFGLGSLPRVLMAALLAIFPIVISTAVGLVGVDEGLILLGRSATAKRLRIFRIIRLPAALPSIFGGLKVGIGMALTGAVVGELVGGNTGLGYVITSSQGNLQLSLAFAAIALLALAGIVLFYLLELIEKMATHR